ncbi:MAG TPA: retropepsin-like aspartic protease [Terriglobales bacterium]|nr:retropepsin-like aspartic protease [Terriglobales bacterium]
MTLNSERVSEPGIRRLFLALLLTLTLITADSQSRRPADVALSPDSVAVPFDLVFKHLIVKAMVNHSRPLAFILDTGDKLAIVDIDCAKELGLKLGDSVQGSGGGATTISGAFVQDAQFALAGLDGFSQPVTLAFPLHSLSAPLGRDIDGLIGSDFLLEFVTEIDYESRVIRLHRKDTFQYTGPGKSIPMQLSKQGNHRRGGGDADRRKAAPRQVLDRCRIGRVVGVVQPVRGEEWLTGERYEDDSRDGRGRRGRRDAGAHRPGAGVQDREIHDALADYAILG